jgi:regulator of protease activity HflC (stomatin/prohibitin superfamily)
VIDRLVDLLIQAIRLFQFFTVVMDYERGVILRLGRFHRLANPGFHWMWPFNAESLIYTNVVPETMNVGPQSLTTKDGVSVVVGGVVTFAVEDAHKFLLEIEGGNQVIEDATYGIVSRFVMDKTWDELRACDIAGELSKAVRRQAKRYGVNVQTYQISDFTRSRSFRLMASPSVAAKGYAAI